MITYTLKVVNIRQETPDAITIGFKQPALRKIKYKAGQYLSLIFYINGRRYIRPYSFSSSPSIDPSIEVTIKRVSNGIVSNHIHDKVKIGDIIEVIEPMGDFTFMGKDDIKEIYFWGAGSGITPLISLIKDILANNQRIKLNLIYGNRNHETIMYSGLINSLLKIYAYQFKVWHFLTQLTLKKENPYIIEGRINKNDVLNIVKKADIKNTLHYICGPAGLKESVKESLYRLKVPAENVKSEDFELIKNPKDFAEIHTRIINLKFHDKDYLLEVVRGKSILETALDSGLDLPYSCQTGNCNTCKAICLRGNVKMVGLINVRLDLDKNEYLLCCSHPLTEDVCVVI